jgi:hypothetical protein
MSSRNQYVDDFDVESLDVDVDLDSMIMIDQEPHEHSTPNNSNSATLDVNLSDDPFAPREGKTLLWRGVNMTLVRKSPSGKTMSLLWLGLFAIADSWFVAPSHARHFCSNSNLFGVSLACLGCFLLEGK